MLTTTYDEVIRQIKQMPTADQLKLLEEVAAIVRHRLEQKPQRSIRELRGLGKEVWEGIDAQEYVNQERDSWDG